MGNYIIHETEISMDKQEKQQNIGTLDAISIIFKGKPENTRNTVRRNRWYNKIWKNAILKKSSILEMAKTMFDINIDVLKTIT